VFNDEYYETNCARLTPSHNISPESIQPVVRLDRDVGERVLALMKWGMVLYWSKTPKTKFSSINARSDELESSGAYREIDREICVGERIQFTAPDRSHGITNRDLAAIESIASDGRISARLENNRQV